MKPVFSMQKRLITLRRVYVLVFLLVYALVAPNVFAFATNTPNQARDLTQLICTSQGLIVFTPQASEALAADTLEHGSHLKTCALCKLNEDNTDDAVLPASALLNAVADSHNTPVADSHIHLRRLLLYKAARAPPSSA